MINSADVEQYKTQGYCVWHEFLSGSEVDRLQKEIESISAGATLAHHDSTRIEMEPKQEADGTKMRRIYEPCTYYEVFREFAESSRMVNSIVQLLGPDVLYSTSKINVKPPEIGSVVAGTASRRNSRMWPRSG